MEDNRPKPELNEDQLDQVAGGAGGLYVAAGDVNGDGATAKKTPKKPTGGTPTGTVTFPVDGIG